MREIKFRGKRFDNGEWESGYLLKAASTLIAVDSEIVDGHWKLHKVDPATVGQYINLKDKNGREIYEGDIVFTRYGICIVEWDYAGFEPFRGDINSPQAESEAKVIGNIYDNYQSLAEQEDAFKYLYGAVEQCQGCGGAIYPGEKVWVFDGRAHHPTVKCWDFRGVYFGEIAVEEWLKR